MDTAPNTTRAHATNIADLHTPVLCDTILELLTPVLGQANPTTVIDATLGMGGHSEAILRRFPQAHVIGIDRDPAALALAGERLAPFRQRFRAVHTTYDQLQQAIQTPVNAILMDLGVSSLQLDEDDRGFSYSRPAPLDMRMDTTATFTAEQLVNEASRDELTRILRLYGEERYARRIATRIVEQRQTQPLTDSTQLAELVRQAIPAPARRQGGHPAKRTFQALRIAVNDELGILERAIPAALAHLQVGGRLLVESYHSLEDRLVKQIFTAGSSDHAPPDLPIAAPHCEPPLRLVTRKAIKAGPEEISHNPRSQSVRLRAVEITRPYKPTETNQQRPARRKTR